MASFIKTHGLSSCVRGLSGNTAQAWLLHGIWDRSYQPGLEPVPPALEGRFLTTVPSGKPWHHKLPLNWALPILQVCSSFNVSHLSYEQLQPSSCSGQKSWCHSSTPKPNSKSCWSKQFQNTFTTRSLLHTSTVTHLVESTVRPPSCFYAFIRQSVPDIVAGVNQSTALLYTKCPLAFHFTQSKSRSPHSGQWAPGDTPSPTTLTSALPLSAVPILLEPRWPHTPASGSLLWLLPLPGILLPQIFALLMYSITSLFKCHITGQTVFLAAQSSHSPRLTLLCWSHQHPHHLKHRRVADSTQLLERKLHEGGIGSFYPTLHSPCLQLSLAHRWLSVNRYWINYWIILSHPSIKQAQPCFAFAIRRDQARSGWYGRRLNLLLTWTPDRI